MRWSVLLACCALLCAGCGPDVDLTKALQVEVVSTGWFDAGIVNGQNKLVPTVTFALKNVSEKTLSTLQVNALFRRVTENDEWGSGFLTVAGSDGLAPGATSPPLTIKSPLGYTGSDQSRQEMLQNTHFVEAKVELFANGHKIREARIKDGKREGIKWSGEWTLPRFKHDVHLVAIASGPGVTDLFWPIARPYQPTSPVADSRVR